ncbi:MAG: ArgE/DapE family deacylase [Armatimonadota bacterium]|nr:ArgE/DapE family deacylase [Armatimonadota bacterium]MDR7549057.1 ArgE/DapE family deacylase [Armatimonadota bacterium]
MEISFQGLWAEIERRREWVVDLCREIVRHPTENPPGSTISCADFVAAQLADAGLECHVFEPQPGLRSLVSSFGEGSPHFMFNGHMDVFPADDPRLWDDPPFEGVIRNGRLYGRGVADMKGGFTASLASFLLIRQLRPRLRGRISFMAVADEETGGLWGTQWILERHPDLVPDACLIGEPCSPDAVRVGEKGISWISLTSRGRSYHGSLATGENAITLLAEAITIVKGIVKEEGITPPDLAVVIEDAKRHYLNEDYQGREWLLEHPSCNVGVIRGGIKANIAPREATAEVDIRIPFGWEPGQTVAWVQKQLKAAGLDGIEVTLVPYASTPNYTSPRHPFAQMVRRHATDVMGFPPSFTVTTAATDGRFFRQRGVPTIIYGPRPNGVGGLNEHITLEDLIRVTKVHAATALEFVDEKR